MKIRRYNRTYLPGDPFISLRRKTCYCSQPGCGVTKPRITGLTLYVWKYYYDISFKRPKGCDAPF